MNFDGLPLIHRESGAWMAVGFMVVISIGLVVLFWRKRYLARTPR
jgi:Mg2+ and Co2+ transporter CorA